jgi:hypothetical protein
VVNRLAMTSFLSDGIEFASASLPVIPAANAPSGVPSERPCRLVMTSAIQRPLIDRPAHNPETLAVYAVQIGCSFMSLTVPVQNQIDEPHSSNGLNTHHGKNRAGISGRQSRLGGARIQFP